MEGAVLLGGEPASNGNSHLALPDGAAWHATATGLHPQEFKGLSDSDAKVLAMWHAEVAGDVAARPFWPAAIRRLSLEQRMLLASDPVTSAVWKEREKRRIIEGVWEEERLVMTGLQYFVGSYGHVQPEDGPPLPFTLWSDQIKVLTTMEQTLRQIILKARQLGLTWLALHHAFHMLAFDPRTPVAKIMALSKKGEDASKLLNRARRINVLLPPYLRLEESDETKRSLSKFGVVDRGEMVSLTSNPDDARSETASYVIWDEAAFTRNGQAEETLTALLATLGQKGRLCIISTGNGPAEVPGDGQTFARLWEQAESGDPDVDLVPIFLPDRVHPGRGETFRRKEAKKYLSEEDFLKEHPEAPEHAFELVGGLRAYSPAGINAAEKLGREYDELLARGDLPLPEFIRGGADFGESTHIVIVWPLEGGGAYIAPGEVAPEVAQEVGESARQFVAAVDDVQQMAMSNGQAPDDDEDAIVPLVYAIEYDAAGAQSIRTVCSTIQKDPKLLKHFDTNRRGGKDQIRPRKVAFAKYKKNTEDYARHLFSRSAKTMLTREGDLEEDDEDYCDGTRILAISPQNRVLLRQLRGLERKETTGETIKREDHGPDAMVAGIARMAASMQSR